MSKLREDIEVEVTNMEHPGRRVHPDDAIERSRRWSRSAVATAGAATLGLAGWIAVSSEQATAVTSAHKHVLRHVTTNPTTNPSTPAPSTSSPSTPSSSNSTPTRAPSISTSQGGGTPQGTTSGS